MSGDPVSDGARDRGAGIVVRGGRGGTVATLDRLRAAAARLRTAADLLDDAAGAAGWAEREGLGPAPDAAITLARAHAAVAPVVQGGASLPALAATVRALSVRLTRTADTLERAEADAGSVVRGLLALAGQHLGSQPRVTVPAAVLLARVAVPGLVLAGAAAHATGRGPATARLLATTDPGEHAVQALVGLVRGLAPGTAPPSVAPVAGAARGLTTATAIAGVVVPSLGRRPLRVTARLGVPPGGPAPRDAADVLARVAALYPLGGRSAGTVGVDRLDHPDGRRTWVVAVPGTQAATSFGGSANPMDMATNVQVMAARADDSSELVTRALGQAGAAPGEPVLLVGHSQGGMVAMALAGSAAFTARHPVPAVVTAGSPVALQAVPAGTAVLHLEHRQDLVPALDGWRNPDQPHRTTAVRDLGASPLVADRTAARSPGAAHGAEAYVRTAAAVATHGGPSVRGWERAAAPVLGGPGVTVARHEFTGERTAVTRRGPPPPREPAPPRSSVLPDDARGGAGRSPAPSVGDRLSAGPG